MTGKSTSSASQEEEGTSLLTQKQIGLARAKQLGLEAKVWNEGGQSSASETLQNRPVLSQLLDLIDSGQVKHLFVYNTDRLSRNEQTWHLIRLKLVSKQVVLYTSGGQFSLDSPMDKLLLGIMSEISSYDNLLRSERINLGKSERIRRGGWQGGPPPFGYKVEGKRLVEETSESCWVRFIYESYRDGKSIQRIRSDLLLNGVKTRRNNASWSLGSIEKLLQNTHYGGYYYVTLPGSDEKVRCQSPQILDARLVSEVRERREKRSHKNRTNQPNQKRFYLLQGLLKCSECGLVMGGRLYEAQYRSYYYCPRKERAFAKDPALPPVKCSNRVYLKIQDTNDLVWKTVIDVLGKSHLFKEAVKKEVFGSALAHSDSKEAVDGLKRALVKVQKEITEVTNSIVTLETDRIIRRRSPEDVERILVGVEAHRLDLVAKQESIEKEILALETKSEWIDWLGRFSDRIAGFTSFTDKEKQDFLRGILEKIEVSTVDKQKHRLTLFFKVPYVDDGFRKNARTGKARRNYDLIEGRKNLEVELPSKK